MSSRRGNSRENKVLELLSEDGWFGLCGRASRGPADILAVRGTDEFGVLPPSMEGVRLIVVQVKSTAGGPYERFLPMDRWVLADVADRIGAQAWLAFWPPRGSLRWIHRSAWPMGKLGTPAMRPV